MPEWYMLSSCVCVSITSQSCINVAKHIVMQTTLNNSSGLLFWRQRSFEIPVGDWGSLSNGVPNTRGVETIATFDN